MKKYKTLSSLSLGGDLYFFDKNIFDKFIKKEFKKNELITREKISKILSSKDYLRFNRTSLLIFGKNNQKQDTFLTYHNSDVKIIANSSIKKINELFISTTNLEIEKEFIKEHTEEDLLDLENKKLIILERDKKSNKIKSIKTNDKAKIDSIIDSKDFNRIDYLARKSLTNVHSDIINEKKEIERYIQSKLAPRKITYNIDLDEDSISEILEMTNYNASKKKSLGTIEITSGNMVIFCVKSVSDLKNDSNQSCFSLKVPNGMHKLFQCFDKSYKYNLSLELNSRKRWNQLEKRSQQRYSNLKGTDIKKWEEDDEEMSNWHWEDYRPEKPNIHFLYFEF